MAKLRDTVREVSEGLCAWAMGDKVWIFLDTGWDWFDDKVNTFFWNYGG